MVKTKDELEDYITELENAKYKDSYQDMRIHNAKAGIKAIGRKVNVPEYGTGVIVSIEVFKEHWVTQRYLIEITDNTAKPILKSLFPDNIMAFWSKDFTFIN